MPWLTWLSARSRRRSAKELEQGGRGPRQGADGGQQGLLLEQARDINGMKVLATRVDLADDKVFRHGGPARDRIHSGVVAIGGEKDGRAIILVVLTKSTSWLHQRR